MSAVRQSAETLPRISLTDFLKFRNSFAINCYKRFLDKGFTLGFNANNIRRKERRVTVCKGRASITIKQLEENMISLIQKPTNQKSRS